MVTVKARQPEFHFQNPPGWKERTSCTKVVLELAHAFHGCPTLPCTLASKRRKTHIQ